MGDARTEYRRSPLRQGKVRFYFGPMSAGKSTLALQTNFNFRSQGRYGLLLTKMDRSGGGQVTSRIGLNADAIEVEEGSSVGAIVAQAAGSLAGDLEYVVCDEAQFLTPSQVEELCEVADDQRVDVFGFGLLNDFRTRLFPGSARLLELADEVHRLQAQVLCWCGEPGTLNARVVGSEVARSGDVLVVGDTIEGASTYYVVLCRAHHRSGTIAGGS